MVVAVALPTQRTPHTAKMGGAGRNCASIRRRMLYYCACATDWTSQKTGKFSQIALLLRSGYLLEPEENSFYHLRQWTVRQEDSTDETQWPGFLKLQGFAEWPWRQMPLSPDGNWAMLSSDCMQYGRRRKKINFKRWMILMFNHFRFARLEMFIVAFSTYYCILGINYLLIYNCLLHDKTIAV